MHPPPLFKKIPCTCKIFPHVTLLIVSYTIPCKVWFTPTTLSIIFVSEDVFIYLYMSYIGVFSHIIENTCLKHLLVEIAPNQPQTLQDICMIQWRVESTVCGRLWLPWWAVIETGTFLFIFNPFSNNVWLHKIKKNK